MSKDGDCLVGQESKGAALEHAGREIPHHRFSLHVEVAQHFVRAPATEQTNDITVDMGTKESHGARGPQRAGGNVFRGEAIQGAQETN